MQDANKVIMGEGGAPSAKFPTVGTVVSGRVLDSTTSQQTTIKNEPKTWADGTPMMQAVLTLQTDQRDPDIEDDDGQRRLFVKGHMVKAVREAVKAAGCKEIAKGATLAVQYTSDGPSQGVGMSPPKYFRAQYKPPAVGVDDLLGGNASGNGEPPAEQLTADDLLPG